MIMADKVSDHNTYCRVQAQTCSSIDTGRHKTHVLAISDAQYLYF